LQLQAIGATKNHNDCNFCTINIAKYRKVKGGRTLTYPSIPLSIAPVPQSEILPVLNPPPSVSNFAFIKYRLLNCCKNLIHFYILCFCHRSWNLIMNVKSQHPAKLQTLMCNMLKQLAQNLIFHLKRNWMIKYATSG